VLQAVEIRGLEARSAALILSGQEAGELDVSFIAVPLARESRITRLTLVVDLVGASLIEAVKEDTLFTEVYAFALDGVGGVTEFLGQGFALNLEEHTPLLARGGVRFLAALDLPPGDYSIRVLVLQRQTGRFSLRKARLALPESQGESPPSFWTAVFPATEQEWILVRESTEQEAAGAGVLLPKSDPPWLPSSRGTVEDETLPLHLVGWGIPTRVEARILDPRGSPVQELVLSGINATRVGTDTVETVPTTLNTIGLAPGDYLLEVGDHREFENGTPPVPFTVLANRAATIPTGEDHAPRVPGRGRYVERDLTARYLQSLDHLLADNPTAARDSLLRLEESATESGRSNERELLGESLSRVASHLAYNGTEGLVPIIWLHVESFRDHRRHQRFALASHARQMAIEPVGTYADHSVAAEAEQLVACAFSSLAGHLQEVGATLDAQGLFERALRFREDHPAALLGLGIIQEALGEYERAASFLRRFLKLRPDESEASLRLAVNLRRLGLETDAESLLATELSVEDRDWVAALAHQELASLLAKQKRVDEAVRLLQQAVDKWPHLERFYIQLAQTLDSADRPLEAMAVVNRLTTAPRRIAESPRLRYGLWSSWVVEEDRRYLADAVRARLPDLEEALLSLRDSETQKSQSEVPPANTEPRG
jgi:tetratricopeptide (TPR) repeat protein